jgi:5-methylcytosine-specific restriction endonuclease McrA
MAEVKRCSKCQISRSLSEFSKSKGSADGYQYYCKACKKSYARKYEDENKSALTAKRAEWKNRNREKVLACQAVYRETHREQLSAARSAYWKTNPDRKNAAKQRRRASKVGAPHEPYERSEIFSRWNGSCAYCDAPAQHLDHVHPISKGGADAPHNLVPACAPCNLSKGAKTLAEWSLTFGA